MTDPAAIVSDDIAGLSLEPEVAPPAVSPPVPKTPGVVAVDITEKFAEAAKTIPLGQLVKDGFFTLFESVAALEIMDPKMDSGCVKPGDEFEELYDVSRPLLPEEVLGIIDELLCHEMSWHSGYPLSQTVFTSVYVEALLMPTPLGIRQANFIRRSDYDPASHPMLEVLRAYCLGMLKACGHVNERIMSEHYYEEEDFVTNTYNRTLLAIIPSSVVQKTLVDAQNLLQSMTDTIGEETLQALVSRLELRRIFLDATECAEHMMDPARAREPWKRGLSILPSIKSSHAFGKPVDEAFSVKLQRKLTSTMPPRPIVHLSFDVAYDNFLRLFQDGLELIDVLNYTDSQCLQTFVSTFQAKKPQPLVYVRTLLQTFLFNEMEILGSMSIRQLLDDDFSIITLPASLLLDRSNDDIEAVQDPRFSMSQQMEFFRERAANAFLDILRTACQNRSRVRRTLCHIVRDWENLQADAEEIDQILQELMKRSAMAKGLTSNDGEANTNDLPLSSWTYLYKLRQMEGVIQLGFELEVYQTDELAGMYWYLNYLAKCRLQHSDGIKTSVVRRFQETRAEKAKNHRAVDEQLQKALAFTRLNLLDAAVTWELSDALCCLYTVLVRLKLIVAPSRPYSDDELRYELRVKPFAAIELPSMPSFEEFTAGTTQPDSSTEDLLEYGVKAIAGAKKGLEAMSRLSAEDSFSVGSHERWAASVKNGLKSCIAAGIAITTVQNARAKAGDDGGLGVKAEVPTPDQAYHSWWIIPRVVPCL